MAEVKSVIELLTEQLSQALYRIAILERELERLCDVVDVDNAAAIRSVLNAKNDMQVRWRC